MKLNEPKVHKLKLKKPFSTEAERVKLFGPTPSFKGSVMALTVPGGL